MAKKAPTYAQEGHIQVRISSFAKGVEIYDGVKLVRVKSNDYTLLIMEDYFPMIGSVDGQIELVTNDEQIDLGELEGFYIHRDNEFSLLLKEKNSDNKIIEEDEAHDYD